MNWDRPVKEVYVKQYTEPIFVDKCIAKHIRFIDGLKDVKTIWACCGHGHKDGSVIEFVALFLPKEIHDLIIHKFGGTIKRIEYQDRGQWLGYELNGFFCKCSRRVRKRAAEHFGWSRDEMK